MKYLIGFLLSLSISCQSNDSATILHDMVVSSNLENNTEEKKIKKEQDKLPNKDEKKTNIHHAQFGEKNWIDLTVFQTRGNIKAYADEFERIATVDLSFDNGKELNTQEELQDFCHINLYEIKKSFEGVGGQISFFVNPLSFTSVQRIATHILSEVITEVENPFKILKKHVEIEADFLDQSEKNLIIENGALEMFDELDFLRVNLFHPWAGPGKLISSVITRLFCGIADGKASILYIFHDEKNAELKVRINGVNFKLLSY